MKYLSIVSAAVLAVSLCACKTSQNTTSAGPVTSVSVDGDPMLLGRISRKALMEGAYAGWFNAEYNGYTVNAGALAGREAALKKVEVQIFMGTWCSDSQREVPRFYKILDQLGISEKRVSIVAVDDHADRRKTSPGGEEKGKNIEYVPTFIFLRDGMELGRIVESPQSSLEADMASILSK